MVKFIWKRLLRFIPVLVAITIVGFLLTTIIPDDPVERILVARYGASIDNDLLGNEKLKSELRNELGLDKPLFYFSVNSYNQCDTLYRIPNKDLRNVAERLTDEFGCWPFIQSYLNTISSSKPKDKESFNQLEILKKRWKFEEINQAILKISETNNALANELQNQFDRINENQSTFGNYIPTINFYGWENQYHYWLFGDGDAKLGLVQGDLGTSFETGQPISEFFWKRLGYSLELIFIAMILAFAFGIPAGLRLSRIQNENRKRIATLPIYLLYSVPGYLGATLLIYFFANDNMLHLFPESGIYEIGYNPNEHGYWSNLTTAFPYMVLPMIAYGYTSFAFISKLTSNLSSEELRKDYARTAFSKGLSKKQVVRKHILKNILIPIITLFTQLLPAAVGGTLIIEMIFQYPGLGQSIYNAANNANYPVIVAAFTITGLLTVTSYLIADILYMLVDPKLKPKS